MRGEVGSEEVEEGRGGLLLDVTAGDCGNEG